MTLVFFKRLYLPLFILITTLFLSSCASRQDLVYFQDADKEIEVSVKYVLTYKPDDLITISVSALDMDAVRPFNLYVAAFRGTAIGITSTPSLQTYLIDATGNIDFPVIGTVPIGGLSRKEATRLVTDKLLPYIKDPIVNIRITNFKISVLGEVNAPGTFNIPNERVTLPEALGLARDLNIQCRRANILIIREVDGKITKNYIDLRTNALFSSPFYYLQQNDVVYIEPNNSRIKESRVNPNTSIFLSSVSILISLLAILTR